MKDVFGHILAMLPYAGYADGVVVSARLSDVCAGIYASLQGAT